MILSVRQTCTTGWSVPKTTSASLSLVIICSTVCVMPGLRPALQANSDIQVGSSLRGGRADLLDIPQCQSDRAGLERRPGRRSERVDHGLDAPDEVAKSGAGVLVPISQQVWMGDWLDECRSAVSPKDGQTPVGLGAQRCRA